MPRRGNLFKQISFQDKVFLNVSWETHGETATSPEDELNKQASNRSKFGNPHVADLDYRSATEFTHVRKCAMEEN